MIDDDSPIVQKIHTMTDERRENRKRVTASLRKSMCAKAAVSSKQGLTQKNSLLKRGIASYSTPTNADSVATII
jgi:hypothetical protein